ncbi:putative pentatricopeptide repeat-containing protein [Hibiscus syriacus]|uniref:Putative pentatricopeptide repeat-containing protein n=1 Tax=Hibiscus syriacus TaxID=106335 RepID=A0A6A2ZDZ7_HIBSY|nr:LOB domain-containing protein 22-like [Hibiscus syriacus]XP_039016286.1 LOB domain-containing protein 22-like [Hibiscus syriacus]KAE8689894.1 putative pentatricopeptide repeat-containing protein [Hibiscus syriacus]KAE8689897.1 putative pentatricopeptide repeat-containing protein [Hibiscus syriacus]
MTEDCAACKYQHRRCTAGCIFAPYFPHDREQQFENVRKYFPIHKVAQTIINLDRSKVDIAMRNIIVQSDMRAKDPVGGCYRIIQELEREIECKQAELDLVYNTIVICRAQGDGGFQMQKSAAGDHC